MNWELLFDKKASPKLYLVHTADQVVDLVLTVAEVTTLDEVVGDASVTASWGAELESPQEVVGALEVGADGVDLVDQVLDGLEADVADVLLDDGVVVEGDALAIDLKNGLVNK